MSSRRGQPHDAGVGMGLEDRVDDQVAGDARDRRRPRRVDLREDDDVGIDEGVGVLARHHRHAVEAVRLEHGDHPLPAVTAARRAAMTAAISVGRWA